MAFKTACALHKQCTDYYLALIKFYVAMLTYPTESHVRGPLMLVYSSLSLRTTYSIAEPPSIEKCTPDKSEYYARDSMPTVSASSDI
jgi:hypothetical protein